MQRTSSSLELLLSVYSLPPVEKFTLDSISEELLRLLRLGDSSQARFLLDSSELRWGPWDEKNRLDLINIHVLVLLCEGDVHAARFLTKRSPCTTQWTFQVYQLLWEDHVLDAMQLLTSKRVFLSGLESIAVDLLLAKLQAQQLVRLYSVYTRMTLDSFAKELGLVSKTDVERFCTMSPNFQFKLEEGDFVAISKPVGETLGVQRTASEEIEKLTRMILNLQAQTYSAVSAKGGSS